MFKHVLKKRFTLLVSATIFVGSMFFIVILSLQSGNLKENSTNTGPSFSPVQTNKESPLYGLDKSRRQLPMMSEAFIIRPGQSRLTYTKAVELYENDTLQFNEDCQLVTTSRVFNLNNEIMIDNRSSKSNIFTVGNSSVAIGSYDFAFMILKEKGTNISVGCGDNKNVANLIIQ